MTVPSILARILERKAEDVAGRQREYPVAELRAAVVDAPPARGFGAAVAAGQPGRPAVIAEVKRASPSQGVIRADFDPPAIARSYEAAGAACLSVLTERDHFHGAERHLVAAREACALPVLRKDFIIDPWQVWESRWLGADAILLIVAALDGGRLQELHGLAGEAGLDVLVEIHDEAEWERARVLDAALVGVNNRDLRDFEVDLGTSERLRQRIPADRTLVAESGIHRREDVDRLAAAGIGAYLVGEAFMRQEDPGAALQALFFDP